MSRPLSPALQKLIAQFGEALPQKLADIRDLHCSSTPAEDDALQTYYTAVHRLAGSAGSYGYRPVSESARILDRYLSDVIAGERTYDPSHAQTLLDDLARTIDNRDQTPDTGPQS